MIKWGINIFDPVECFLSMQKNRDIMKEVKFEEFQE